MTGIPRDRFGSTLVVATIAVLLTGLLLGSLYEIYARGEKSNELGIELAEASQNARNGVDLIVRELRSAGFGVDSAIHPSIIVGSQYRVTFTLDRNGNHRIDRGEVITYFLDPSTGDPLVTASANPFDFVLRRAAGADGDPLATPVSGHGEIVVFGLTQRSRDTAVSRDVPLFSYRDSAGTTLELKTGSESDPVGVFFGKTVSRGDLGFPPGARASRRVKTVLVSVVTETKQRNLESGHYDRVTVAASVEPCSTAWGMEVR
jgi:Tfp pilus assembly protein PilW